MLQAGHMPPRKENSKGCGWIFRRPVFDPGVPFAAAANALTRALGFFDRQPSRDRTQSVPRYFSCHPASAAAIKKGPSKQEGEKKDFRLPNTRERKVFVCDFKLVYFILQAQRSSWTRSRRTSPGSPASTAKPSTRCSAGRRSSTSGSSRTSYREQKR